MPAASLCGHRTGGATEPLLLLLGLGLAGGLVVAVSIARFHLGAGRAGPAERLAPTSPGLINMAHIRVEGIGGLGLVAMAAVVSVFQPPIRVAMTAGLVLGIVLAGVLIALRRRSGPLPHSGHGPGAHSMFPLEDGRRRERDVKEKGTASRTAAVSAVT